MKAKTFAGIITSFLLVLSFFVIFTMPRYQHYFRRNNYKQKHKEDTHKTNITTNNPQSAESLCKLAIQYYRKKKFHKALQYFKQASDLLPNDVDILCNVAQILFYETFDIPETIRVCEKIISLDKKNRIAYEFLSNCYLRVGNFEGGNHARRILDGNRVWPKVWDGSDVQGKTIVIDDNIGIGDLFCWIRYGKMFKDQGAKKVIVYAKKVLVPLLSLCPYIDELIIRGQKIPYYDFKIGTGQLHHRINKTINDIYKYGLETPYLYADKALTEQWAKKLTQDSNFKIGICWSAKQKAERDFKYRPIPLKHFYPISKFDGVSLYSLQQKNNHGLNQLNNLPQDFNLTLFDETFDKKNGSFMDTAAVMKNVNLIITVDTSIAHLAGALGVKVWLLLPHVSDWRWFLDRTDSPWYPTMRIFRQKKLGDWDGVMQDVMIALKEIKQTRI